MGMTNEEKRKRIKFAYILLDVIANLNVPMLMYDEEKEVTREALENYIKMLKQPSCEDCISREAVEKITWEEPSYDDALNVLTEVRDKVRALSSVKPEIKWIPVSEKLPNSYEYILATMISPVTQLPFVSKLYTGENAKEKIEESKVIAWMVLPKPYKEKK